MLKKRSQLFTLFFLVLTLFWGPLACQRSAPAPGEIEHIPAGAVDLLFLYGSEKEKWINDVTAAFNQGQSKTSAGHPIHVKTVPMGSGECIDAILSGSRQADLVSPASAAFIKLGNAQSRTKTGKDLVASTDNLVLSPVVIAMWKPMAEAIGWGKRPIGWSDILSLARDPSGWARYKHPEWGRFKFGHTHPEYSNSGLISLFAESYAAVGKTAGLSVADIQKTETARYVSDIEKAIVHYGSSTGFFGHKMFDNGPQYLSAAVLYENMVIEAADNPKLVFPVVAIYPKEGTFWSDHPVGIVERDWVTPERREAAKTYIQYLLARDQQQKALQYGFRPALVDIPLASPIDTTHGVDPKEPKTTLEVPSVEVIDATLKLWHQNKKHSNAILVIDTSGSMNDNDKIGNAKQGSHQFLSMLDDGDTFAFLRFSNDFSWGNFDRDLSKGRSDANLMIDGLFADGQTALYDAISVAYDRLSEEAKQGGRINALVVLTDGADNQSHMTLEELLNKIKFNGETQPIRVFTIAYGDDAQKDVLKKIADVTQAKFYEGTPQNIVEVFKDISTFF